jgi:hypothetical protein
MLHISEFKNIQLGYTLNPNVSQKAGITKLRLYAGVNNLYTFTKYKGFDPGSSAGPTNQDGVSQSPIGAGIDYGFYPVPRTYLLGLNINFLISIKMKKYLITTIITLTLFSTISISCSDEFVSPKPKYSIDSENYFNSKEDYDDALVATYDLLQSSYVNVLLGEIASDNTLCGGESPTDVIGFQQIDDMIHTPVNSNLRDIWNWMFAGVQRANYILEFKDKTDFEGKNQLIAETRFSESILPV